MRGLDPTPSGGRGGGAAPMCARASRCGVARMRAAVLAGALGVSLAVAAVGARPVQAQPAAAEQGAPRRGSIQVAPPGGERVEFAGSAGRGSGAALDVDRAGRTGASWDLDPRMVALALALAGAAVGLVLHGRREARARERDRSGGGLPPRRTPRARNLRAQGVLTGLLALKFGKLLFTGGGMLVSLVAYAVLWGWWYAAGFVALLFAHELGHVAAARLRGVEVSAMGFVPLVGAYVSTERTSDPDTEFQIAIGGPLLGTMAAFACLLWGSHSGEGLWFALAYTGFALNLFNLAPVPFLDGGTATAALGPRVWLVGVPVLAAVVAWQVVTSRFEPLLLLAAVLGLPHAYDAWRSSAREPRHWFADRLSPRNRAAYATILFGLMCSLAAMMHEVHAVAQLALGR